MFRNFMVPPPTLQMAAKCAQVRLVPQFVGHQSNPLNLLGTFMQ